MNEITNSKVGPVTIIQLVAIIGGIIGIVALFLTWCHIGVGTVNVNYSGLDFLTNKDWSDADYHKYMPLLAMVMALLGLIVSIMPMVKPGLIKSSAVLLIIFGILGIIFAAVFYSWSSIDFLVLAGTATAKMSTYAGIGIWISIIGNVIILLCGLADIFMTKKVISE